MHTVRQCHHGRQHGIIALFLADKSKTSILRELAHLNINKLFVHRTIKRYNETGSVEKRYGGGRKKTATSPKIVRHVKARINRNPRRSGRKMAKELKISRRSMQRILKNMLSLKPLKIQNCHNLTPEQMKVRVERAKLLKRLHASGHFPNIVFSDEKTFTIEQSFNKQNDRIYLPKRSIDNFSLRSATTEQNPGQIMVWAAVIANGRSPLIFLPNGIKVNGPLYRQTVLEAVLKPWTRKHFQGIQFIFQQDSAPSHKANDTQEWLRNNVPHFISREQWPPYSPDANPLDYSNWGILQEMVGKQRYQSVDALKTAIRREWMRIPEGHIRAASNSFFDRLAAIIRVKGKQIEIMQ